SDLVRRRAVDLDLDGALGERRRRELVVDAPARVVVERAPAPRPPRERAGTLAAVQPPQVDEPDLVEPRVDVRALLGQEAGALEVALPVLDVGVAVGDVEIAREDDPLARGREGAQPGRDL